MELTDTAPRRKKAGHLQQKVPLNGHSKDSKPSQPIPQPQEGTEAGPVLGLIPGTLTAFVNTSPAPELSEVTALAEQEQSVQACRWDRENVSSSRPFIEANTLEATLEEIREGHIIPVFIKDNEPVISHVDLIEAANSIVRQFYMDEEVLQPAIRLSHPIKGRIPEARNKPAAQLEEHEKTLYYERMAFVIEVPSVFDEVEGNRLSLCIGGVKAYNLDNLYNRKGADEHFKCFIGFKNSVCTNLSITTDGYLANVSVRSIGELQSALRILIENYNSNVHLHALKELSRLPLTEAQFAKLTGRCRMYPYLPRSIQKDIAPLLFNDTQMGTVVRDFYRDDSFCRQEDGTINLWRLYNLFTDTNKSSYIDNFLDRNVNAFSFVYAIKMALDEGSLNWFLS